MGTRIVSLVVCLSLQMMAYPRVATLGNSPREILDELQNNHHMIHQVDDDPEFLIGVKGLEKPLCFHLDVPADDVIRLIQDPVSDVGVNARTVRQGSTNKFYLGAIMISQGPSFKLLAKQRVVVLDDRKYNWTTTQTMTLHGNRVLIGNDMVAVTFGNFRITLVVRRHFLYKRGENGRRGGEGEYDDDDEDDDYGDGIGDNGIKSTDDGNSGGSIVGENSASAWQSGSSSSSSSNNSNSNNENSDGNNDNNHETGFGNNEADYHPQVTGRVDIANFPLKRRKRKSVLQPKSSAGLSSRGIDTAYRSSNFHSLFRRNGDPGAVETRKMKRLLHGRQDYNNNNNNNNINYNNNYNNYDSRVKKRVVDDWQGDRDHEVNSDQWESSKQVGSGEKRKEKFTYVGFYISDSTEFSNKTHGLLGQFLYRKMTLEKIKYKHGQMKGQLRLEKEPSRRTLAVYTLRSNAALNTTRACWRVRHQGQEVIDGSYGDYLVPSLRFDQMKELPPHAPL